MGAHGPTSRSPDHRPPSRQAHAHGCVEHSDGNLFPVLLADLHPDDVTCDPATHSAALARLAYRFVPGPDFSPVGEKQSPLGTRTRHRAALVAQGLSRTQSGGSSVATSQE